MVTPRAARRLASAAAYGGGGLGVLGGVLYGLIKAEAGLARRAIGEAEVDVVDASGTYGADLPGDPIRLLMLGDSAAAGYGMTDASDTPAGMIGHGLSQIAGRPVRVTSQAVVGGQSKDLQGQIGTGLPDHPVVAVIIVGVNDVTHTVRPAESVRLLNEAVRRLRHAECEVVVGTCPDLGTIGPIQPPLRQVARLWSRRLAAAQTITAVEAGARTVSLGALLGPEFAAAPGELFGADRFHPSLTGYASVAAALLPSVAAAVSVWDDEDEPPAEAEQQATVLPISFAAARAAAVAGTEVSRTRVGGRDRGPRGRWAQLVRRRREPLPPALTTPVP